MVVCSSPLPPLPLSFYCSFFLLISSLSCSICVNAKLITKLSLNYFNFCRVLTCDWLRVCRSCNNIYILYNIEQKIIYIIYTSINYCSGQKVYRNWLLSAFVLSCSLIVPLKSKKQNALKLINYWWSTGLITVPFVCLMLLLAIWGQRWCGSISTHSVLLFF